MSQTSFILAERDGSPNAVPFREPNLHDLRTATDAILESFVSGEDAYDLQEFVGTTVLNWISERARVEGTIPALDTEHLFKDAARCIARSLTQDQWAVIRREGV